MPKLMDRVDWIKTVADVGSAEGIWCENISGDADTVSFSLPESGRYRIILVKLEGVHRPNGTSQTTRNRKISPKVRALRGAAKVRDGRDYKDILTEALVEKYEALG